jgi:hypothetical protein
MKIAFRPAAAVLAYSLIMAGFPSAVIALSMSSDLRQLGWKIYSFSERDKTQFRGMENGDIQVTARKSAGFLYREIPDDDRNKQNLSWRWKVEESSIGPTKLNVKGGDDRPLAVHVLFPDPPEEVNIFTRIADAAVAAFVHMPISGKSITYVWGGIGERGDMLPNPYSGPDGVLFLLRPGESQIGTWVPEEVNVAADFERAFGTTATLPSHIVVSADADDTKGHSIGMIGDIRFHSDIN